MPAVEQLLDPALARQIVMRLATGSVVLLLPRGWGKTGTPEEHWQDIRNAIDAAIATTLAGPR